MTHEFICLVVHVARNVYAAGMTGDDLTTEQAAKLKERVGPMAAYLRKLLNRLDARHFPPDDRFRKVVEEACTRMQHLTTELHYMSCAPGTVGRKPK
jgi:hypothetical protein